MTFGNPVAFSLLCVLPALFFLRCRRDRERRHELSRLIYPGRFEKALVGYSPWRKWGRFSFQLGSLLMFIFALARPQLGMREIESFGEGRNVIIAIDTSLSMLAEDSTPNRLSKAKLIAEELIERLPEDNRIGLITFAGTSQLVIPLSIDKVACIKRLQSINYETLGNGSDLGAAIELARETLLLASGEGDFLIILSDGEDHEGGYKSGARRLRNDGVVALTFGVGRPVEIEIRDPRNPNQYLKDTNNQNVMSRLNTTILEEIANETVGRYFSPGDFGSLDQLAKGAVGHLDNAMLDERRRVQPIERFQWPLGAGILLSILALVLRRYQQPRKNVPAIAVATATTALLFIPPSLHAEDYLSLYQQGRFREAEISCQALLRKQPSAPDIHRIQFGLGTAAYKDEDFTQALAYFGKALTSRNQALQAASHYNIANALVRRGRRLGENRDEDLDRIVLELENAIVHYDCALELNKTHKGAKTNREIAASVLERLRERKDQRKSEEPKGPSSSATQTTEKVNSDTGFTASEARAILGDVANQDEVTIKPNANTQKNAKKFW